MKKYLAFLIAAIIIFSFSACGDSGTKKYTYDEMTITLPDYFTEMNIQGYTIGYEAPNGAILALKEDFETYPVLKDYSLAEYADLVVSNNSSMGMTKAVNTDGVLTSQHTFLNTDENVNYTYLSAMYRSGEGFWLIQFACKEADFENMKPYFMEWAKSVSFK